MALYTSTKNFNPADDSEKWLGSIDTNIYFEDTGVLFEHNSAISEDQLTYRWQPIGINSRTGNTYDIANTADLAVGGQVLITDNSFSIQGGTTPRTITAVTATTVTIDGAEITSTNQTQMFPTQFLVGLILAGGTDVNVHASSTDTTTLTDNVLVTGWIGGTQGSTPEVGSEWTGTMTWHDGHIYLTDLPQGFANPASLASVRGSESANKQIQGNDATIDFRGSTIQGNDLGALFGGNQGSGSDSEFAGRVTYNFGPSPSSGTNTVFQDLGVGCFNAHPNSNFSGIVLRDAYINWPVTKSTVRRNSASLGTIHGTGVNFSDAEHRTLSGNEYFMRLFAIDETDGTRWVNFWNANMAVDRSNVNQKFIRNDAFTYDLYLHNITYPSTDGIRFQATRSNTVKTGFLWNYSPTDVATGNAITDIKFRATPSGVAEVHLMPSMSARVLTTTDPTEVGQSTVYNSDGLIVTTSNHTNIVAYNATGATTLTAPTVAHTFNIKSYTHHVTTVVSRQDNVDSSSAFETTDTISYDEDTYLTTSSLASGRTVAITNLNEAYTRMKARAYDQDSEVIADYVARPTNGELNFGAKDVLFSTSATEPSEDGVTVTIPVATGTTLVAGDSLTTIRTTGSVTFQSGITQGSSLHVIDSNAPVITVTNIHDNVRIDVYDNTGTIVGDSSLYTFTSTADGSQTTFNGANISGLGSTYTRVRLAVTGGGYLDEIHDLTVPADAATINLSGTADANYASNGSTSGLSVDSITYDSTNNRIDLTTTGFTSDAGASAQNRVFNDGIRGTEPYNRLIARSGLNSDNEAIAGIRSLGSEKISFSSTHHRITPASGAGDQTYFLVDREDDASALLPDGPTVNRASTGSVAPDTTIDYNRFGIEADQANDRQTMEMQGDLDNRLMTRANIINLGRLVPVNEGDSS